jgi:hypothetical protein
MNAHLVDTPRREPSARGSPPSSASTPRPFGEPFAEKLVRDPAKMAWARALVDRLGG